MTGFVAVSGCLADTIALEDLHESRAPDAPDLLCVVRRPALAVFATSDLPTIVDDGLIAVGDVLAGAASLGLTLAAQRRAGLQALVDEYRALGAVPGDFGIEHHFILVDLKLSRLVAGRDALGVRPIFYTLSGAIVGSALRLLLAAGAEERPDDDSVRRFVAGETLPPGVTYVAGVRRLRLGEQLWCDRDGVSARRVGEDLRAPPKRAAEGAVEAFRARLEAAVAVRTSTGEETVALLSGGLDSSAISVVGVELARRTGGSAPSTLSATFDETPQWSERSYIEAVTAQAGVRSRMIDVSAPGPLEGFKARLADHGGLFYGPGLYLAHRLLKAAAEDGGRVVLDGHGGDEVVSYGWGRLHDLAEAGHWGTLASELRSGHLPGEPRPWRMAFLYWLKYGPLRKHAPRLVRLWRWTRRRSPQLQADLAGDNLVAGGAAPPRFDSGPDLPTAGLNHEGRLHLELVSDPGQSLAMETLHAAASASGLVTRFPFWDRDLLQLCLSLPGQLKLHNGYNRWVLRESMPELPEMVRWRRDKLDFSPHLTLGLLERHGIDLREMSERSSQSLLWSYVNRTVFAELMRSLEQRRERAPGLHAQAVWRVGALAIWLDDLSARSVRGLASDRRFGPTIVDQ